MVDLKELLIERLDHKNLNLDVDFLRCTNPTAENLVIARCRVLEPAVKPKRLVRLRLWETDRNSVDHEGS